MTTFVLCWLFVAVIVGFSGILRNTVLPVPSLCVAMTLTLLVLLAVSPGLRRRALSTGIRAIVAFHLVRFFGIYFVWLSSRGLVPRDYATLAGWGPIIVAIGAIVVLVVLRTNDSRGRQAVMVWNVVGILDAALVLAVMTQMVRRDPLVHGGFTSLPLSLLPTFILPLLIVTHVLVLLWWFRNSFVAKR